MEAEAEKRHYERSVGLASVVRVLFNAFLFRRSSLDAIVATKALATTHKSTLSYCMRRPSVLKLARAMLSVVQQSFRCKSSSVIALDSMAVTLPRTQRSNCAKFNNVTVGGGVLWEFLVNAPPGVCPVRILKLIAGAWNDAHQIRTCHLIANGPLYLMDRGFYALTTIAQWLEQNVRFIVRAKKKQCHFQPLKVIGRPRRIGNVEISFDGIALVGKDPKNQVRVRLVYASKNGEDLILVSNEMLYSAEELLALYKKRWVIERFHKVIKHTIGLAHLYSFQRTGIELLLTISALVAIIIFLASPSKGSHDIVTQIRQTIKAIRRALNITDWKPNTCIRTWKKKRANH